MLRSPNMLPLSRAGLFSADLTAARQPPRRTRDAAGANCGWRDARAGRRAQGRFAAGHGAGPRRLVRLVGRSAISLGGSRRGGAFRARICETKPTFQTGAIYQLDDEACVPLVQIVDTRTAAERRRA